MNIKIKKGLDLPITGQAAQNLDLSKSCKRVALLGADFIGMKPTMQVKVGDKVKVGQPVFSCKKNIGVTYTAPGAGEVVAINRGARRAFQSLVIELDQNEEQVQFKSYASGQESSAYSKEQVKALLLESGEWKSLRQRPFEKVADVTKEPSSVFVTAVDTHPLAPKPSYIIDQHKEQFKIGVELLSKLSKGNTYVCVEPGVSHDLPQGTRAVSFSGPYPAGNPGTHIHFLDPVHMDKQVWHVGYQDVIAIGHLFTTGELFKDKVVTLAGPQVKNPRYIKVRRGAQVSSLLEGELQPAQVRVISGSVLHGHHAQDAQDYLGAYSNQITVIEENTEREFLGWHSPGLNRFSVKNIYLSKLFPGKKFNFDSNANGSYRAMVPIESFEKLMPLDILPTQLLRALASQDVETAQDLGCLELAEEDLALLTFAAPGKVDFGPMLRENLDSIEREG